jgi:hypothetical protein
MRILHPFLFHSIDMKFVKGSNQVYFSFYGCFHLKILFKVDIPGKDP